jgi:type I restriction enzyme R subunit
MIFNESDIEAAALEWFEEIDWTIAHGPHIAPGEPAAERRAHMCFFSSI